MGHIFGIDISKAFGDGALTLDGRAFQETHFSNDSEGYAALAEWLERQQVEELHVCLEATGRYAEPLASFLVKKGYQVSLVNPSRIHDYGKSKLRRNKNDQLDARLIADFCLTQEPDLWHPSSETQRELQELTREITTLKADRQRKRNKLKSGLSSQKTRQVLERHIDFINEQIAHLEEAIQELARSDVSLNENVDLLTSIPGIGLTTAARFLAEVDVSRFDSASQVAAYAGLVPREYSSGTSVRKRSQFSSIGNRHLKNAFYMPALSASRSNPIIQNLVERLTLRGKPKMVIVGAVMRKLLHLAFGVLKTRKPFDPDYLQNIPVGG